MRHPSLQRRTLALVVVVVTLLALFVYVAFRSGPLAPEEVTVAEVESRALEPSLFGIGTVEARYTYKIGPTFAGRVKRLDVHVGDRVKAGQILGEMDPVDLDDRVRSQESGLKRTEAALREATARQSYAETQARRYEELLAVRSTSEEMAATKRQERQIADAALSAAREDLARSRSDRDALMAQRSNLRLISPVDGVVLLRDADPGTTIVAGQAVVEVIDPKSLWINVRFDQISASGLAADLPVRIALRSRRDQLLNGRVLRVEPKADAVTEELLAKVVFDTLPKSLPAIGELAEVTVDLPRLPEIPVISNAAIRRDGDKVGVWQVVDGDLRFTPIKLGTSDLDGYVQVLDGLQAGDKTVIHSEKALTAKSRVKIVERLVGAAR
jgi:RND family efflux transporter MFP subunit